MKHIYVILVDNKRSRFKVGISQNPIRRLIELQTGSPDKLQLGLSALVRYTEKTEKAIHILLQEYRLEGEWFDGVPYDKFRAIISLIWAMDLDCDCKSCTYKVVK